MRFREVLLGFTAVFGVFGASASTPTDTFSTYRTLSLSSTPLDLDDAVYAELTSGVRDFSVAVLLTAQEAKYGCHLCREFQPEWNLLAKSWLKGDRHGQSRLLFGTLDFSRGKNTFQKLMLQTAPVLLLFEPTTGPNGKLDNQPQRFDFTGSMSAEQVHAWISRQLPGDASPKLIRPINYARIVGLTTAVLGALTLTTVTYPYILPIVQNRNVWAAISLVAVLLFTSGHMFNHIRKVPYVAGDGRGGVSYFAGGFQTQYGLETQIVAAMYGVLSFSVIALALRVPKISDVKNQSIAAFVWGTLLFAMYSFLLSVFRIKNGGYPFYLPPF